MDDRRIETRKKLMRFSPVRDQRGALLGFLGNLTQQGALVIGEKPLDVGQELELEIEFPDELPGIPSRQLRLRARVARCAPDEDSLRDFKIGLEFQSLIPEQIRIIEALLDRYHFRYREWARN